MSSGMQENGGSHWLPPLMIGVSALVLFLVPWNLGIAPAAHAVDRAPYVVVYAADAHDAGWSVSAETAHREAHLGFSSRVRFRHALRGFAARLSEDQVESLRRDPDVALVTPDSRVSLARVPLAPGEQVSSGISRIGAAADGTVHEASHMSVAILDTGIDLAHPDLNSESGVNCVGSGPAVDDNGHGTHVAGVVAARNDGSGTVGVAPGTKVLSVKVLDKDGFGLASDVICGIDWVTAHAASLNIKAANLSLGEPGFVSTCGTDPLHLAVCNSAAAGVTYAVAAGNDARSIGTFPVEVPASYPEIMAVTAMSDTDGRTGAVGGAPSCIDGVGETDDHYAQFSNYALSAVDASHTIAAPGVCIRSTFPGGAYASFSGTSVAAPHVAGTIALCFDEGGRGGPCAGLRPAEVIQKLRADAARNATVGNGFLGDPNSSIGFYYGFLVSVLESPRPLPPPAETQSGPASADRAVSFRLLKLRSRGDIVYVAVRMGEPGTLTARGVVNVPSRASAAFRFPHVTRHVGSTRTVKFRLKLAGRPRRKVRRALKHGRRLKATVVVKARDLAGNSASSRRIVRLRRNR